MCISVGTSLQPRQPLAAQGIDLLLIGGGGHALVVAEAARGNGLTLGVLDDRADAALCGRLPTADGQPARYLGSVSAAAGLLTSEVVPPLGWMVTIGNLATRERVLGKIGAIGIARSITHPRAIVSASAAIEPGVFIGPGAIVNAQARVCAHAIVNSGAIVEHGCVVGENTHIAPGAVLGGEVTIGAHTLVGIGSRVLPGVTIGERCVVGAGAVVTRDVPHGFRVVGVPAQ